MDDGSYTDAQISDVVGQIRRNKPPAACCPACDTTLLLDPVIRRLIDKDGDGAEVRGARLAPMIPA